VVRESSGCGVLLVHVRCLETVYMVTDLIDSGELSK